MIVVEGDIMSEIVVKDGMLKWQFYCFSLIIYALYHLSLQSQQVKRSEFIWQNYVMKAKQVQGISY